MWDNFCLLYTSDYGINPVITFTDFRKSIVQTDADIAVVVLPGVLHFEADRLALEKGMNLITEKPLAMDMEEAMELLLSLIHIFHPCRGPQ